MRKLISIVLVFLLTIALSLPAMAVEGGQNDEGFYIEELPAFGEDVELIFPTEETPMPEPVEEATTVQESDGEDSSVDEQSLQNDPVKGNTEEEEENRNAESLSPLETELTPSENHFLPVIIIVVVLLAAVVTVVLIKKRKPTEHRHLDR